MKKWILVFVIVIVALSAASINIYQKAMGPINSAKARALQEAKQQVTISEVDGFHIYHGLETVSVIEGKNKKGEKIIVWVPEKSKKIVVKKEKSGISKQEAINILLQERKPKKIISVRLGMEKNIPLWEIYYRSENNLINYYYVSFETGGWLKNIDNL